MKTKFFYTIIAIVFFCTVAISQDKEKSLPSGYITVNFGSSIPLGDYSNKYVGSAISGTNMHLNFSMPIKKHNLGITSKVGFNTCQMSSIPFIEQQKSIINSAGYTEGVDYDFLSRSTGDYTQTNFLTGLFATFPVKRISIDSRVLFGCNITTRPETTIDFYDYADNYYPVYTQKSSTSTSFSYNLGFSLRANLGKKQRLCFAVNMDYIGAKGNFDVESNGLYTDGVYIDDGKHFEKHSYSVSTFEVTVGLGYVFNK